jgi:hypothetical protein
MQEDIYEKGQEARLALTQAPCGDNADNEVDGRLKWCIWGIPRSHTTRNRSEIFDICWSAKLSRDLARKNPGQGNKCDQLEFPVFCVFGPTQRVRFSFLGPRPRLA